MHPFNHFAHIFIIMLYTALNNSFRFGSVPTAAPFSLAESLIIKLLGTIAHTILLLLYSLNWISIGNFPALALSHWIYNFDFTCWPFVSSSSTENFLREAQRMGAEGVWTVWCIFTQNSHHFLQIFPLLKFKDENLCFCNGNHSWFNIISYSEFMFRRMEAWLFIVSVLELILIMVLLFSWMERQQVHIHTHTYTTANEASAEKLDLCNCQSVMKRKSENENDILNSMLNSFSSL